MAFRDILNKWRMRQNTVAQTSPSFSNSGENTSLAVVELLGLGTSERQGGQYDQACRTLMRAIDLKYDCGEAHHQLGQVYLAQERFEDAADSLHLATHFSSGLTAAYLDLGYALARLGRHPEAEAACRRALELEPGSAGAWFRLGQVFETSGDFQQALDCYRAAIGHDSLYADAHCELAFMLYKVGRYEEARASFEDALSLRPRFFEAHHNLGLLLLETGYAQEALTSLQRALDLRPQHPATLSCMAHAMRDLGRLDEALAQYDVALASQPRFGDAEINRCYALLMKEDYAAGWDAYECRFVATQTPKRGFPFREWCGEPLAGKRILIYAEQGLGDEIMFASCLPDLLQSAAHVVVECNTRLRQLFARSFPQATVHGGNKNDDTGWIRQASDVDFQAGIGSLPRHFRRAHADFPARRGYLSAEGSRVDWWKHAFPALGTGLRVGISWRGGALRTRQLLRSAPLPEWRPVLEQRGVEFVSLQYGRSADEIAEAGVHQGSGIRQVNGLDDLDELAAVMSALDLVITIDNTVAHLAGALGRPVWILLPFSPEWRYLRSGAAMPWYPSARLFRQREPRAWVGVMDEVAAELAALRRGVDA